MSIKNDYSFKLFLIGWFFTQVHMHRDDMRELFDTVILPKDPKMTIGHL